MIPQTFTDWTNCIEQDCKIDLTKEFAAQRLAVYQNLESEVTKRFISLYGVEHL